MNRENTHMVADAALAEFRRFYADFLAVPEMAKQAFESRDHGTSLKLSADRLQLYSVSIREFSDRIIREESGLATDQDRWSEVELHYAEQVRGEYSADLAMAFLHSIRRKIYQSEWRVEDYARHRQKYESDEVVAGLLREYRLEGSLTIETVEEIFNQEGFNVAFRDPKGDAERVVARANQNLNLEQRLASGPMVLEMFPAGFYRNRGAYLVGRIDIGSDQYRPFILALLNSDEGLYVDALITSSTYAHNMFSSTLANFHVTNDRYHDLCRFLRSIMPMRPLGLHYSTIGYNHLGKVAVMNELEAEHEMDNVPISVAPGVPGTVAIGFCKPASAYVLKVIRNEPTSGYKWGEFEGVDSVLRKYTRVHEINRTDSMLDSMLFYNLRLPTHWFDEALINQLLEFSSDSVTRDEDGLVFKYLIVQRKLVPLPVYLENASEREAETAMINLGYCIRNNAAGNIFNRDLDARNYGVTAYRKIYLFDYDALEQLTDVKIRTNLDRIDGEEDIPDWYFEDGVVFLPEELTTGLCLPHRDLRRLFQNEHAALHRTAYWDSIQQDLARGEVPSVSVYPESERLG